MVYRKRARRSHYIRNAGNIASAGYTAAKALTVAYQLKKLINVERHTLDVDAPSTQSSTGTMTYLCAVAQGDDQENRQGRSVRLKSLESRGAISSAALSTATQLRCVWFIDKNNQGVAPVITDVMKSDNVASIRSGLADNLSRYKILKDQIYRFSDGSNHTVNVKFFRKMNSHLKFSGTSAAEASAGQGSIWLYTVSNEASNVPTLSFTNRIRFIDN